MPFARVGLRGIQRWRCCWALTVQADLLTMPEAAVLSEPAMMLSLPAIGHRNPGSNLSWVILLPLTPLGVVHICAVEEVGIGWPGRERSDGYAVILRCMAPLGRCGFGGAGASNGPGIMAAMDEE